MANEKTPSEEKDKSMPMSYEELLENDEKISSSSNEEGKEVSEEEQLTPFEKLIAKKGFKGPDDLAKSYEELEREFTRRSEELARIQKMIENFYAPPSSARTTEEEEEIEIDDRIPTKRELVSILNNVIHNAIRTYAWQSRVQAAKREIEKFKNENPDEFKKLHPIMLKLSSERDFDTFDELLNTARKEYKKYVEMAKSELLGELSPEEIERLKMLRKKMMEKTGVSGVGGGKRAEESAEEKLLNEIFGD